MQVKAIKDHRYGSKQIKTGQEYEIKGRSDYNLYIALGWVVDVPKILTQKTETPTFTKVMTAEKPSGKKGKKGKYQVKELPKEEYIEEPVVQNEFAEESQDGTD